MIKLYQKFLTVISNIFKSFIPFTLAINSFLLNIFTHFVAYLSSFGKFFSNFEFIFFGVFLQVFFYFFFLSNSYVDFSNEAIWFFCLFSVVLLVIGYFNATSSEKKSLNALEQKIKSIEDQLSLNFQINQEISNYNHNFVNYNVASSSFIINLHVNTLNILSNFSSFKNLSARFVFIINESFSKQLSYFIKVVDFKENQLILASINDFLSEIVSEDE